jgi:hypothetical protein
VASSEIQTLFEDVVRFTSRGTDRPCLTWTPHVDVHDRYRTPVCDICRFPEAFHLLARAATLLSTEIMPTGSWDAERAARVNQAWMDLRAIVGAGTVAEVTLGALRFYALEARPDAANEKDAAAVIRGVLEAAKGADIQDKALQSALDAAAAWLAKHDLETSVSAVVVQP